MVALNEIPESLRTPSDDTWTPRRGLVKGTISTVLVSLALGVVLWVVTMVAPPTRDHWAHLVFNGVWVFLAAWVLFAVMHKTAGMASGRCTVVVVLCTCLLMVVKHLAVLKYGPDPPAPAESSWAPVFEMIVRNWPAFFGLAIATFMCRNGDSILHDLAETLSQR